MHRTFHSAVWVLALCLGSAVPAAFARSADQLAAIQATNIDLSQAITAVQTQHALKIVEAEIDLHKKQPVFEFKGINAQNHETKLKVSAVDTTKVIENKDEGVAKSKYSDRLAAAKISIQDAIAAALKHTPGKAVEVDLDDHLGVLSYDVKVIGATGKKTEVRVNAVDSSIKLKPKP